MESRTIRKEDFEIQRFNISKTSKKEFGKYFHPMFDCGGCPGERRPNSEFIIWNDHILPLVSISLNCVKRKKYESALGKLCALVMFLKASLKAETLLWITSRQLWFEEDLFIDFLESFGLACRRLFVMPNETLGIDQEFRLFIQESLLQVQNEFNKCLRRYEDEELGLINMCDTVENDGQTNTQQERDNQKNTLYILSLIELCRSYYLQFSNMSNQKDVEEASLYLFDLGGGEKEEIVAKVQDKFDTCRSMCLKMHSADQDTYDEMSLDLTELFTDWNNEMVGFLHTARERKRKRIRTQHAAANTTQTEKAAPTPEEMDAFFDRLKSKYLAFAKAAEVDKEWFLAMDASLNKIMDDYQAKMDSFFASSGSGDK